MKHLLLLALISLSSVACKTTQHKNIDKSVRFVVGKRVASSPVQCHWTNKESLGPDVQVSENKFKTMAECLDSKELRDAILNTETVAVDNRPRWADGSLKKVNKNVEHARITYKIYQAPTNKLYFCTRLDSHYPRLITPYKFMSPKRFIDRKDCQSAAAKLKKQHRKRDQIARIKKAQSVPKRWRQYVINKTFVIGMPAKYLRMAKGYPQYSTFYKSTYGTRETWTYKKRFSSTMVFIRNGIITSFSVY